MFIILQILVFIRAFISSLAFPYLNSLYSACIILFLLAWGIASNKSFKNIKYLFHPLLIFCLAIAISIIFSVNKLTSLFGLYDYIIYLLLLITTASLGQKEKVQLAKGIFIAGFIISLLALYQYCFGFTHILNYMAKNKISDPFALDYISRRRVFFPFVTSNALGGYLAMISPLALVDKKRAWLALPILLALLLTKSLGAILSLFIGLIIYLQLKGKPGKKKILPLCAICLTILFIFIARTTNSKEHATPGFSAIMRLDYWLDTLRIIWFRPLTGVGIGNFTLAWSRFAHNSYLQICAEMGVFGTVAFLWLIFRILRSGAKEIKTGREKDYTIALITAISIFLMHNLVDFTFFLPEVAMIWWIMLGMIIPKI